MSLQTSDDNAIFDAAGGIALGVEREDGSTFAGVLDRPYRTDLGISGFRPTLTGPRAQIADLAPGEALWIDGEKYGVAGSQLGADQGSARLVLLNWTVSVDLGTGFAATWIDESVQPQDPDYLVLRWNLTGSRGHLLFQVDPAQLLPHGATRCGYADLQAKSSTGDSGPDWASHQVLRAADLEHVSWARYRTGSAWARPGCLGSGSDFISTPLGSGSAAAPGWVSFCDTAALAAAITAAQGQPVTVVVHSSAWEGESRFYSGSLKQGPAPRLTLRRF